MDGTRLISLRGKLFFSEEPPFTHNSNMNFNSVLYFLLFCLLFHCFDFITHLACGKCGVKVCVCVFRGGSVGGLFWGLRFSAAHAHSFFQAQHAPKSSHELKSVGETPNSSEQQERRARTERLPMSMRTQSFVRGMCYFGRPKTKAKAESETKTETSLENALSEKPASPCL